MRIQAPGLKENMAVVMPMEDFPYLPSGLAEVNKMIKEHGDLFSDSQCKVCSAVLISESQKLTHYQSKKHANKVRRYLCIQGDQEPACKKTKPPSAPQDCNNGDTDRFKACHMCNMTFSSPVMAESHYQGKVHAKNLRLKTAGPNTPASPAAAAALPMLKKRSANEGGGPASAVASSPASAVASRPASAVASSPASGSDNPDRFCSICQATFNNPLMAQQHYMGKKHKKHMTKVKLMETYGPATYPASTVKGYSCSLCNMDLNSVAQYQAHISGAKHKNQMKKSGVSPAEPKENEAPSGENQYSSEEYPAEEYPSEEYPTEEYPSEEYPPGESLYPPEQEYSVGDDQYSMDPQCI